MTVANAETARTYIDLLNGARAIMADPDRVVLNPGKNGYETAAGERLLLDDDETVPGVRCSFATAARQAAFERGMSRFDLAASHVFGMLHLEVAERGHYSLNTAQADGGADLCLDVIDAVLQAARA